MGDSIPHWAGVRARETGKPNLRTTREIGWHAVRGLKWHGLRRAIETEVLLGNTPNVIIIHLGGNDLASESVFRLKNIISKEVCYSRTAFPAAILVWVDIIQRRTWVGASDAKAIEKKRVRVNRLGRSLVAARGPSDAVSCDIKAVDNFFRADGVHLSDLGIEFYLDYLRDVILKYS